MMSGDRLVLQPIRRLEGTVALPGSKSLSNRALLLAALARGETRVEHALDSDDTRVMVAALRQLGVGIAGELAEGTLRVAGCGGPLPGGAHTLFLGNAGTAMRPLAAGVAGGPCWWGRNCSMSWTTLMIVMQVNAGVSMALNLWYCTRMRNFVVRVTMPRAFLCCAPAAIPYS